MIPGATCASCILWDIVPEIRRPDGRRVGQCRRHAPTLYTGADGRQHSSWPTTPEDAWCGEHAVAEEAAA